MLSSNDKFHNLCTLDLSSLFRKLDMAEITMQLMKNAEHRHTCSKTLSECTDPGLRCTSSQTISGL